MKQTLVIQAWHPQTSPNGSHGHWAAHQKKHDIDRDMAWASAKQAGWVFVPGKVRLTITLVYPRNQLPDSDNAYAKCKGLIDGLKKHSSPWVKDRLGYAPGPLGFFEDDNPAHLELDVRAVVEKGVKAVHMTLESV